MIRRRSKPIRGRATAVMVALVVCFSASAAFADTELPILSVPTPRVRVDGWLREWPMAHFATVGLDSSARMRFAFAAGDAGLYVAVSVDDDRVIRSTSPGAAEDAVVVTIASPNDRGLVASELWLFAGVANETAATLTVGSPGGRADSPREASIVEMPTASGYDLEAFLPWSAVPGGRDYARARASARLHDVDRVGAAARDIASSNAAATDALPRVVGTAGELLALSSFLRAKHAQASQIETELRANFAGDGTLERVVVVGGSIAVFGTSYANGRDFDYVDLGVPVGAVGDLRAADLDADGHAELILVSTIGDARLTVRELRVYRFPGDRIVPLYRGELSLVTSQGRVESEWSVESVARRPAIVVRATAPQGTVPSGHAPAPDSHPVISLTSGLRSRTIVFDANGATVSAEDRVAEVAAPAAPAQRPAVTPTPTRPAPTTNPSPQTSRPTPPAFDADALFAAVRRDRSLPSTAEIRFRTEADVAEDARPEQLAIIGRSLVLLGPGYRAGRGYYALDLAVPAPEFVTGLSAADITGDGEAEVWTRVRQTIGTANQPFWLELLVVYSVGANGLSPIFTAQVGLGDESRSVRNDARVVGRGRTVELALSPGRATGFDARSFPFGTTATPGMTSLLLPWRDREVRYRWDGRAIVSP